MRNWQAPTRRTALFLALLAVTGPALHAEDAMNSTSSHFAYIGTYNPNGEGVYRVQVDPASGALSHTTLVSKVPNPAQLTLGADGKTLYVASEVADFNGGKHGGITAYRVNPADGGLTQLNQVDSQGRGRCISSTPDGRYLLVANYVSGSVAAFPIEADGSLGAASSVQQQQARRARPNRRR